MQQFSVPPFDVLRTSIGIPYNNSEVDSEGHDDHFFFEKIENMSNKPRHRHAVEDKENIPPDQSAIIYPEAKKEGVKNLHIQKETIERRIIKEERDAQALKIAERDKKMQDRTRLKLSEIPNPQQQIIKSNEKEKQENEKLSDELSKLLSEKAKIFDEIDNFELVVEEPKKKRNNLINSSAPKPLHAKLSKQVEVFEANIKMPDKLLTKKNDEFIAKMKNSSQGFNFVCLK